MFDYRRMGRMEWHLGNTTSTMPTHHLRDLWKSPRGTVLRIEALAVVAIITTFFLIAFGSCRRWSSRWIVQKGFFAAHVLSLSLGTYSIGLMQSSPVRSEMYPIWTVCLFTLFGCIDPVTAYNGLDFKDPLAKVVYGIFLHCGYVVLMTMSTTSSVVGNTAIGVLSAITFLKGFHRAMAFVQQTRMRNMVQVLDDDCGETCVLRYDYCTYPARVPELKYRSQMVVDFGPYGYVTLPDVNELLRANNGKLQSCYDACFAFCLSHKLQRYFLGFSNGEAPHPQPLEDMDCERALKLIGTELAFLYEVFFTGNPFLHYFQAKTASLWALASLTGICFIGVAAAISGTATSCRAASGPGGCNNVVDTTTIDLVITFVILVSLALLQLLQLTQCWTSNWARVAVACAYARNREIEKKKLLAWWMRLKAFVATSSNNWFDKYLWQDKIGQYSILADEEGRLIEQTIFRVISGDDWRERRFCLAELLILLINCPRILLQSLFWGCVELVYTMLVWAFSWAEVLWILASDTNKKAHVRLDDGVKTSIINFIGKMESDRLDGNWLSFPVGNHPIIKHFLHLFEETGSTVESHAHIYAKCVMRWHTATRICELVAEQEHESSNRNRHVACTLSMYCAYLVVSAPELLPGPAPETTKVYDQFKSRLDSDISFLRQRLSHLRNRGVGFLPAQEIEEFMRERRQPRGDEVLKAFDMAKLHTF